jgi:hypothetical protein
MATELIAIRMVCVLVAVIVPWGFVAWSIWGLQ